MDPSHRVLKAMLTFPLTWLAAGSLVAAETAFITWFEPGLMIVGGSALLAITLVGAWWLIGTHSEAFVEHLYPAPARGGQSPLIDYASLMANLEKIGSEQGLEQLDLLGMKLETVREVLRQRLSSGELTFARYIGVAEQVYLNAVDNLREVCISLTAVNTIEANRIDSRLRELESNDDSSENQREVEALEGRKRLLEEQEEKVNRLIVDNETMMTALDNTAAKLADAKIGGGHATMDAKTAMAELVRLAERAHKFER